MSYKFYLKRLTANELGYRNGKLSNGQMFFISKQAATFFPTLKNSILNDSIYIMINVEYCKSPIFVKYVFHNDKYNRINGTRDEYRIYLNRELAPNDFYYRPNDIIVFEKLEKGKYNLYKFREDNYSYNKLNDLINISKLRGLHALTNEI